MFQNNYLATNITGTLPSGSGNSVVAGMPSDTFIFARPQQFNPGSVNLSIYNGSLKGSVDVKSADLGLKAGDKFTLICAENPLATPIVFPVTGEFVSFPMAAGTVMPPSGLPTPASLRPRVGLFILRKV